jgi:hypothetical protein
VAVAAAAVLPSTARAASDLVRVTRLDQPPPGHRLSGRQALRIAADVRKTAVERRRHGRTFVTVYMKGPDRWQVSWSRRGPPAKEIAQVIVDDATGAVLEAWTGPQVAWTMARGYPGAFGRKVNSPWVWLGLTALFVVPFIDLRRGRRTLALDMAAIAALGVSVAFFNAGRIGLSVPLAYPPLLYLLARMLWIGLRRRDAERSRPAPRLLVPVRWLGAALVFLIGFRVTLNLIDSNVIDVGYSGVIGADRLGDGADLWGAFPRDNAHGDTYGPVAYAAYVPFEAVFPWHGGWDGLAAAHAAAIAFDLTCLALLWRIGSRIGGPTLAIVLPYAWAACPFTLYVLNTNGNDALVAALVLGALAAASSPPARGALVALAGWAKFAPLALAPLFAAHRPRASGRSGALRFAAAFALLTAPALGIVLAAGGLGTFVDRTLGFQGSRDSPFSVWGLWGGGWEVVQVAVQVAAVLLAVAVAVVPRRRDVAGLAALAAAVLIALQLGATHWFYLYCAWFLGPVLVALLAHHALPAAGPVSAGPHPALRRALTPRARGPARSRPPAAAGSSG